MKILHTSDWHLGRVFYGRHRYDEFAAFLDWLARHIEQEKIELLLIAGDIFDTTTPSNRAQNLYYSFLCRNTEGEPEAIVCAVPYLRDRDIRTSEAGESIDEKRAKLAAGYRAHYQQKLVLQIDFDGRTPTVSEIPAPQRPALTAAYAEILQTLEESDPNKE